MTLFSKMIIVTLAVVTLASVATWQMTGGDWYTKYQVVEEVESTLDPNDPLAAAGFYDGNTTTETVTRDEFRFGLLPTPASLFDKHAISVASVTGPAWTFGLAALWYQRRKTKQQRA